MLTYISEKTDFFALYTVYIEGDKCFGVESAPNAGIANLLYRNLKRSFYPFVATNLRFNIIFRIESGIRKHTHYCLYTYP